MRDPLPNNNTFKMSASISPVIMIPGLTSKKRPGQIDKLLRRPLAHKVFPSLVTSKEERDESNNGYIEAGSVIKMFQASFLDALKSFDIESDNPTDGVNTNPSIVCPPPTTGSETRNNLNGIRGFVESSETNNLYKYSSLENCDVFMNYDDTKYILDPVRKQQRSFGTHVNVKKFSRPYKQRGPDPLPARTPKKNPEILMYSEADDERYYEPPAFVLEHFIYKLAEKTSLPVPEVRKVVYSKHNVKKLTDLLTQELNPVRQETVHTLNFDPSIIPYKENRIPWRQLLYEVEALMKDQAQEIIRADVKSVMKFSRKYRPEYSDRLQSDAEIFLYEDDSVERTDLPAQRKVESEMPGTDAVFHTAYSRYFQGLRRSTSPLCVSDDEAVSPTDLAVLDSLVTGGTTLSFKAHFIDQLPDITPMKTTLTHLNLCFNNFQNFPSEVLELSNLEILKMRNNPLVEISTDINRLRKLRVLIASFCLITALPKSLFDLPCLEDLSVAYNRLTFIPSDICRLQSLQVLDIEGNQVSALPATCLTMGRLAHVNVRNNFMHPLFWKENTKNKLQTLLDLACVSLCRSRHRSDLQHVSNEVNKILAREEVCDVCKGPLFGPGLRMIRPMPKLFLVKHVPLLFRACTPGCLQHFQNMSPENLSKLLYGE